MSNKIHIVPVQFKEVIPRPTNWMFSWGIFGVTLTLFILITLSIIFPYQESLECEVNLKTTENITPLISSVSGIIKQINLPYADKVSKNQVIAEINDLRSGETFLVKSPSNGFLSAGSKPFRQGNTISYKDTLAIITPDITDTNALYCIGFISGYDLTKIKVDNEVSIILDYYGRQYPASGTVSSMSMTPNLKGEYAIFITMKNDNINFDRGKPVFIGMKGQATIVYERSTIWKKIFARFYNKET